MLITIHNHRDIIEEFLTGRALLYVHLVELLTGRAPVYANTNLTYYELIYLSNTHKLELYQ